MRKMKSKLVRLKVWYEHDDGVSQDDAANALEQLVLQSLTQKGAPECAFTASRSAAYLRRLRDLSRTSEARSA